MVAGTLSSVFLLVAVGLDLIVLTPIVLDEFTKIPASELISNITESFVDIYIFFQTIYQFFVNMLDVFPTPFATLISSFLVILFSVFVWKLVKGGS